MGFLSDIGGWVANPIGKAIGTVGGKTAGAIANPMGYAGEAAANKQQTGDSGIPSYGAPGGLDAIGRKLNGMQGPTALGAGAYGSAYKAKDMSGPLPEYDTMRNKVGGQINSAESGAQDAVARKFASMGMTNSGAAVKQQELTDQDYAGKRNEALNDIGFQEAQTRRGLQEQEANKEFQSGEGLNQRQFQGAMFNNQQQQGFNQFQMGGNIQLAGMASDQANTNFNAEMERYKLQHSGGLLGQGGPLGTGL